MSREDINAVKETLDKNAGILRLAPCWVPRSMLVPGRRLKLAPQDLYAFGGHRGGIDERWFSSTTKANNGPLTLEDEGLSYLLVKSNGLMKKVLLKEAIGEIGDLFLGKAVMQKYGGWTIFSKFFDNMGPIPHHMHMGDEHAAKFGLRGKSEAYYFVPQLNSTLNSFPYTFFGLEPSTTREDVINCLRRWNEGDNGILYLSKAYKLKPGTGWLLPPGILHAPGTLVTYEPQMASDVFNIFESMVDGRHLARELLVNNLPPELHHDLDYIVGMLDWEANVDPDFKGRHFLEPRPVEAADAMREQGCIENWIVYGSSDFSAKELTVLPGRTVTISDKAAYGSIVVQGSGKVGNLDVSTPTMIRFGEVTQDELFVTIEAAKTGVRITNSHSNENLVILKHFGPGNPDAPSRIGKRPDKS